MPADIVGTNIIVEEGGERRFRFQAGPIFANLVLADEINRATPKTQSALLEAMQEHRVTVAKQQYTLTEPFFVLATQNPLEMEGTYPCPRRSSTGSSSRSTCRSLPRTSCIAIMERTTGDRCARRCARSRRRDDVAAHAATGARRPDRART